MKSFKLLFLFLILSFLTVFFLKNSLKPTPTFAVVDPKCSPLPSPRASGGLITANSIAGNFGTTSGACIIDANTNFLHFQLPKYNELVKKFYDQANPTPSSVKKAVNTPLDISGVTNGLYRFTTDQTFSVSGPTPGSGVHVIFIDENLLINNNISFPTPATEGALVFVVQKNINIQTNVTNIDAVLISTDGDICTAYDGTSCTTTTASAKLIINGSLISLKSTAGLKLVRQLDDNTEPAELINYQPKIIPLLAKAGLLLEDLKIPVEQ